MIGYLIVTWLITAAINCVPRIGGIINFFLSPPLQAGFTIVALAQLKGRPWTFGDFFGGFQKFGSLLGYNILAGLCMIPPLIVLAALVFVAVTSGNEGNTGVALAAGVAAIPAFLFVVYFAVRISLFGVVLILDRDCGAVEAIQGNWRLTRGHVLEFVVVGLVTGLMLLGGALLLLVGFLFVFPFVQLTWTAGYLLIAGSRRPVES